MTDRGQIIDSFLLANDWDPRHRRPLSGDASFRRYDRLDDGTRRAVLMDAPPDKEDVRPFWALANALRDSGYSAPQVVAGDSKAGLLLLEDFGDGLFSQVVAHRPGDEALLYQAAVDVLVDLHGKPVPQEIQLPDGSHYPVPPYDIDLMMREAHLFTDWYLPETLDATPPPEIRSSFDALWRDVLGQLPPHDPVLVLRDYHADNLIWLPERGGLARVGLLDFQDAVAGHPAYDLVSLLEDARRDVPETLAEAMVERYVKGVQAPDSNFDEAAFRTAYAILGAQRNTKIIGIFTRLWRRDGKPAYLDLIPRVWGLLERDLEDPALSAVRKWFDAQVPPECRRTPLEAV
jgi:N-acetylmuramate 1-kinase